jgi:hypothetical protein
MVTVWLGVKVCVPQLSLVSLYIATKQNSKNHMQHKHPFNDSHNNTQTTLRLVLVHTATAKTANTTSNQHTKNTHKVNGANEQQTHKTKKTKPTKQTQLNTTKHN